MFFKRRSEVDGYQIAFLERLDTVETITSATVTIDYATVATRTAVTAAFVNTNPTLIESNKTVQFTMIAAPTVADQKVGRYRVRCVVVTNGGRTLETHVDLRVDE